MLEHLIGGWSYTSRFADGNASAVKMFRIQPIGIVPMDICMPEVPAGKALEAINKSFPGTSVIR